MILSQGSFGNENNTPLVNELAEPKQWEASFILPGWLPGAEGTVGVGGVFVDVDASLSDILGQAETLGAGAVAVRRGKLGFYLEGLYMDLYVGGEVPGNLLSSVDIDVEAILAEGFVSYRFHDSERLWVEVIAGARYTDLRVSLGLRVDDAGIQQISNDASSVIIDRTAAIVAQEIRNWLGGLLPPWIGAGSSGVVVRESARESDDLVPSVVRSVNRGIRSQDSELGDLVQQSSAVQSAITSYARTVAREEVKLVRAASLPDRIREAVRRAVEKRLEAAKQKLAATLEREIKNLIPDSNISDSVGWVDPYIGLRSRYQFTDDLHLSFRGDVGGFGVSSDLTWSLFAAVGYEFSEHITLEGGYRHMATDYNSNGFVYDLAISGPFVGIAIEF